MKKQNRNRPIDIENKLMVAKGGRGWETGIKNIYIHTHEVEAASLIRSGPRYCHVFSLYFIAQAITEPRCKVQGRRRYSSTGRVSQTF